MIIKNKLFISIMLIMLALSFAVFYISFGQSPNIFGGFVSSSIFCNCSFNFLITVGPPVGGQFIFTPGTPQFLYNRLPSAGMWTIGLYSPGGICLMYGGKSCFPFGAPKGTITPIVGTSL